MNSNCIVHVIDDDPAVRDSLAMLLQTEGCVVTAYESASDFLDRISSDARGCVITDVRMPGLSGIDLIMKMREMRLDLQAIVITAHADVPLAVHAMKVGAVDFLEKPFRADLLTASVRRAMRMRRVVHEDDAEVMALRTRLATLSARENEVLAGLLKGKPNKVIAHDMGISNRTVEVHRANIMKKTAAGSLSELVRMAMTVGVA